MCRRSCWNCLRRTESSLPVNALILILVACILLAVLMGPDEGGPA